MKKSVFLCSSCINSQVFRQTIGLKFEQFYDLAHGNCQFFYAEEPTVQTLDYSQIKSQKDLLVQIDLTELPDFDYDFVECEGTNSEAYNFNLRKINPHPPYSFFPWISPSSFFASNAIFKKPSERV